jgi:glycosyltransferase involved in cell wall biosynthesis
MPDRALPDALAEEVKRLGPADIMVGIPSFKNAATIGHVTRAAQAGLVQYFPDSKPVLVNADAGSPDGTGRVVVETQPPDYVERILLVRPRNRLQRLSLTYPEVDDVGGKGAALRTIFQIADQLGVEALVVVDSDLRSIVPEWIELLAGPILKGGFDYVTPLYQRYKYDGTITNTVTYPLTRSLYGLRIRQPIGGDFGVSGDLVKHYLAQDDWTPDISKFGIDIWMTVKAITGGFAVSQTRLGAKIHDPKDPGADLGPMFSQVVATMLRLTVEHADHWLSVHGSHAVPTYGFERYADPPPLDVDIVRLLTAFTRGRAANADAWALLFAPDRMTALEGLTLEAADALDEITRADRPTSVDDVEFYFSDDLWARVIYDLALTARGATMDMDRLIAALVPIYFARVASLVIEARDMTTQQAETLVERQARAFEQAKPSFAERWLAGEGLKARKAPAKSATATKAARSASAAKPAKSSKPAAAAKSSKPATAAKPATPATAAKPATSRTGRSTKARKA